MVLKLESIGVTFGRTIALTGITYEFPEPGIVAIIGANGSGKTTLLDVLSGFVHPTSGRIVDTARGVLSSRALARWSARLHQATVLPAQLTPATYLSAAREPWAGRWMFSRPRPRTAESRAEVSIRMECPLAGVVLDRALSPCAHDMLLGTLSGGQQRAVALAAVALAPKSLLVLDEPFVGLAPQVVEAAIDLIREQGARRTVVVAEHNLHLLHRFADIVLVLNKGTIARVHAGKGMVPERLMEQFG